MLYDYLITQFYPNLPHLAFFSVVCILCVIMMYALFADSSDNKFEFNKRWKRPFIIFLGTHLFLLVFYFWIPDVEYVKYFYGDVRVQEITPQQKAELQAQYDEYYERSKQLLLDCLEKGQKQPHTTVYNDTNEVVQTCYDIAKYKF